MPEQNASPHREKLVIGIRGWDYDDWVGAYYPEELPKEWRFAYYCNDYRGVLAPADHWQETPATTIPKLTEEIDFGFSVVLELQEKGLPRTGLATDTFLDLLRPMESQLRALSWRPSSADFSRSDRAEAARLADAYPLVLDYGDDHPWKKALDALRTETGASRLWRPQLEEAPDETGQFLLALVTRPGLVFLRGVLEQMAGWLAEGRSGGLFLEPTPNAPELAEQCRILAELMEI